METEMKEIIKEKEYVHDENRKEYASKSVGNAALATGIIGTALGAAAKEPPQQRQRNKPVPKKKKK